MAEHPPRHCEAPGCGKSFIPTRSDQRFCSSACRNRAWIKKHPRVAVKKNGGPSN